MVRNKSRLIFRTFQFFFMHFRTHRDRGQRDREMVLIPVEEHMNEKICSCPNENGAKENGNKINQNRAHQFGLDDQDKL